MYSLLYFIMNQQSEFTFKCILFVVHLILFIFRFFCDNTIVATSIIIIIIITITNIIKLHIQFYLC